MIVNEDEDVTFLTVYRGCPVSIDVQKQDGGLWRVWWETFASVDTQNRPYMDT